MKLGYSVISCISCAAFMFMFTNMARCFIHDSFEESEISYPEFIHNQNDSQHGDLYVHFNAFGSDFNVNLKLNHDFVAPNAKSNVIGSNGEISSIEDIASSYYKGKINGDDNSYASISFNKGLEGFFGTRHSTYKLRPLVQERKQNSSRLPHFITRLWRESISHPYIEKSRATGNADSTRNNRRKRSVDETSSEKTIETLLVLDQKMTQYYGLDFSKQHALYLSNIANSILQDPSIGPNAVKLVIAKILLLVAPQDNLVINHHARNTLKSFGQWAELQTSNYKANGEEIDYAILLTRHDICKDKEQPCDNSGVSNIGGMCNFPSSVSVIKDQGLMTAFSIAHHIGHSLGMENDGNGNSCSGRNKIMNSKSGYGGGAYVWSACSVDFLQKFLRTPKAKCLNNVPPKRKRHKAVFYSNPGSVIDANLQCEMFGGEGAKACYFGDDAEACVELQCLLPNVSSCLKTGKPPADGTACGKSKWCKHGLCVEKHTTESSYVNGGWSSWGEFGPCTRTCGGGLAYRERSCVNPRPARGGKYCEGDSRDYQICNKKPCPEFSKNIRAFQCDQQPDSYIGDVKYEWTYVTSKSNTLEASCNLQCIAENDAEISKDFGPAPDGTDCYLFSVNLPGRCVAGECISVGCDLELESRERFDRCGVCKGDGSSCRKTSVNRIKTPTLFVNASDRPRFTAKKLNISQNATILASNVRGYTNNSKGFVMQNMTLTSTGTSKHRNPNGTSQHRNLLVNKPLNQTGTDYLFRALNKLKALRALMKAVLDKKCKNDASCLRKYKYFDLKHKKSEILRPRTFEWGVTSSGCSVTCGVGTEYLYYDCRRVDDGSPVGRKFCSMLPEPSKRSKACKLQSCAARWVVSDWKPCSKSCGGGLQSRNVFCVKTINEDFVVPDILCDASSKPSIKQICNKQACPAMWVTEPFGKCSTTCGKGIQLREVSCKVYKPGRGTVIVSDNNCNAIERPERELLCNVHNPCPGVGNCGGNFTNSSGTISSPNFPNAYPLNKECISEISVPAGRTIILNFKELKINGSKISEKSCQGDFLRVTFGGCNEPSVVAYSLFCGNEIPKGTISSLSNKLCVKFFSDDSGTEKGFSLSYTSVKTPNETSRILDICDVHTKVINSSYGALMSPNYPDAYPMNEYCKVTIKSMEMSGFIISFKDLSIGTSGPGNICDNDYLEVHHNGLSEKVCGQHKVKKATINSDSFTLIFHSGNMKIGANGFIMTFITKDTIRDQLKRIIKKKEELARYIFQRKMMLPAFPVANEAYLRPVGNPQLQHIEESKSLKKTGISHLSNASNGTRIIRTNNTHPSLKTVLDLLAGGQKQQTPANIRKVKGSPNQQRSGTVKYQDNREAALQSQSQKMLQNSLQLSNIANQPTIRFVRPTLRNPAERSKANKALWEQYWKLYTQYYASKRGTIARPLQGPSFTGYPNGYQQQSFVPSGNYHSNWLNGGQMGFGFKACPVRGELQCQAAASLSKCQTDMECSFAQSAQCCQTACPYAPFVCAWTRSVK